MKTENKKKSQKKIQIKGKMPLSVHFFRDAEADALNMERCQLDKATLIACAVKRLREDLGTFPIPVKNLPHDSGDLLGTSGLAVPFLSGGDCVRLCRGRVPDPAQPPAQGPQP